MIRVNLNKEDKKKLLALRLKRLSNLGERAWFVLLNAEGKSIPQIAKQTGHHSQTVRAWIKRYQADGIQGLYGKKPSGRPPKKSKAVKAEINDLLAKTPLEYGYLEAIWTASLLIDYFSKKFISVSEKTIRRVIKSEGWSYKRLSKVPPKEGPTKEEKQVRIAEITSAIEKDKNKGETKVTVLFGDESHFSIQPYVQRAWCQVGKKSKVATSKKKKVVPFLEP